LFEPAAMNNSWAGYCFLQNVLRATPAILAILVHYTRGYALAAAAGHHTPQTLGSTLALYLMGRKPILAMKGKALGPGGGLYVAPKN